MKPIHKFLSSILIVLYLIAGGAMLSTVRAHAASLPACGTWNEVTSPNPSADSSDLLTGVVALSASNVYAVGSNDTNAFIEHWNGSSWAVITQGPPTSSLSAISAVTASNIWAVGQVNDPNTGIEQTYIEHWNGQIWGRVTSPNVTVGGAETWNWLSGVSVSASTTTVWAVGGYITSGTHSVQTLIERWNGHTWSIVASPNRPNSNSDLQGVELFSASSAYAVGYDTDGAGSWLVEHWDGKTWTIINNPTNVGFDGIVLGSIVKFSASNMWDVAGSNGAGALIQHWNGSVWTTVPAPDTGTTFNWLTSVSRVPGTSRLWAVGTAENDTGDSYTLIETFC